MLVSRVRPPQPIRTASVTVLFADLRGYTGMVERLPAARVVPLLDEFVRVLGGAANKFGGEVYHMAGDGIMAGFGINTETNGGAPDALAAGHAMLEGFAVVANRWRTELSIDAGIGIGLHLGEVAFGVSDRLGAESPLWSAIPSMSPRGYAAAPAPARYCFLARSPQP